jgi:hypothetical protein
VERSKVTCSTECPGAPEEAEDHHIMLVLKGRFKGEVDERWHLVLAAWSVNLRNQDSLSYYGWKGPYTVKLICRN